MGLPQDPEQQSLCFFMSKFVLSDRKEEIWGGSLEALPTLYQDAGSNSALSLATAATSMGSIAWNPECAEFRSVALTKYVKSLELIKAAVQDPEESQFDSTLMAVLMLGFYEVIQMPSFGRLVADHLSRISSPSHYRKRQKSLTCGVQWV